MERLNDYTDWLYIGAVVIAFFIFLLWNRKTHGRSRTKQRRSFKQRLEERQKEKVSKSKLNLKSNLHLKSNQDEG